LPCVWWTPVWRSSRHSTYFCAQELELYAEKFRHHPEPHQHHRNESTSDILPTCRIYMYTCGLRQQKIGLHVCQ
jgi:hypothetical protein